MSYETNDKMVSHPDHYKSGKYEVIDIIDEFTKDLSGTEAVCTANAIKYILRWKKKNGIQDVKKAIWYLQHLVDKEEERLQEEHAEFDEELLNKRKEFVDKTLNHIRENSVYGIPKEHAEFDEERLEKINTDTIVQHMVEEETARKSCKTCKHENDINCGDNCNYPNLMDWEPKEELLKKKNHCGTCEYQWNTTKCPRAKETPGTISCENSAECCSEWTPAIIKNYMNSQKVPTKPLKSMEEICEDIIAPKEPTCSDCTFYEKGHCKFLNMLTMSDHDACGYLDPKTKEVDMDKIMNRPTFIDVKEEEIHSCDDCAFKVDDPNMPPCFDCDLHQNPPSKWVAES